MAEFTYFLFYMAAAAVMLLIGSRFRPVNINHYIIGIATVAYSLIYEIVLGDWMGLYYYLDTANSTFYMVLSGIFIYPALNILYILYLPQNKSYFLPYTGAWIAGMLLFEYVTVLQKIIVLTGWKPIPWSLATYAFTYLWINLFYRHLKHRTGYLSG